MVSCIIIAIGLLLTLMSICAVYSLVRKDHVVPIYVINLPISDLIQYSCLIPLVTGRDWLIHIFVVLIYISSLNVRVGFMVCIALERYLLIACPLWYCFRESSVVVSVVVWILSSVSFLTLCVLQDVFITQIIIGTFLLLPLPLLIFFLGGTIRALSASHVPADEKRRIIAILVLVLLIYTLRLLSSFIFCMAKMNSPRHFPYLAFVFVMLSPLADLLLYVFMRKGTIDKFLASVCCCRMDSNDICNSTV